MGSWKYQQIMIHPDARAPVYVEMGHRASLLYSFACVLLGALIERSAWVDLVNLWAAVIMVVFFAVTILSYVVHGALRDTENQFSRPHRLGNRTVPAPFMQTFMTLLMLAEIGGFLVILSGFAAARL